MAQICRMCSTVHSPSITCIEARRQGEALMREVERHRENCEGCPNAYQHVLNLRRSKSEPNLLVGRG